MTRRLRWGKMLRVAGVAVLVLVAVAAAYVRIQQYILRWRAQQLLDDIRQIQMGKSTWADAQRLMTRWGAWGGYYGSCTVERCEYKIVLQDAVSAEPITFWSNGHTLPAPHVCCRWFRRPFRALGGRHAMIFAGINVKDGIVWTKAFDVVG